MKAGPSPTARVSEVMKGSRADSELVSRWVGEGSSHIGVLAEPVCRSLSSCNLTYPNSVNVYSRLLLTYLGSC